MILAYQSLTGPVGEGLEALTIVEQEEMVLLEHAILAALEVEVAITVMEVPSTGVVLEVLVEVAR